MTILGLMSGTSLDGVDLAICRVAGGKDCSILVAETVPYTESWRQRLSTLENATALEYAKANVELGHYFGKIINDFLCDKNIKVDAIASHGHTIFHQPVSGISPVGRDPVYGLTTQIGDGDSIVAETGLPVVCNFRALDVALGGQGAPLVPIGDELMFSDFDACLNLGGIANISFRDCNGVRVAFDICPCNMVLNRLAAQLGLDYDCDGDNARKGSVNNYLSESLNNLEYYSIAYPKSLGKEWFVSEFWPVVESAGLPVEDLLRTVTEHIAVQLAAVAHRHNLRTILVTGGGALNSFLIERIRALAPTLKVTIPDRLIVEYKEALIFALLGYLRIMQSVNTLSSVTGSRCDSVGGDICGVWSNKL